MNKSNYGHEMDLVHTGFVWNATQQASEGHIFVGNSDSTFSGVASGLHSDAVEQPNSGFGPEDIFNLELRTDITEGPFTDLVDYDFHSTKYTHQHGLPLKILQYAWAFRSDVPGATYEGNAIYQTLVIINTSPTDSVLGIDVGIGADQDVDPFTVDDGAIIDTAHDNIGLYDVPNPDLVFGWFRIPRDNVNTYGSDVLYACVTRNVPNAVEWYDNPVQKADSLNHWWNTQRKDKLPPEDHWIVNGSREFDLAPGEFQTISFVLYGADLSEGASLTDRLKEWSLLAGYYRGDVNGVHQNQGLGPSGITIQDVQYLVNFVSYGGPAPVPFTGQGDVNGDDEVDAADISYLWDFFSDPDSYPAPIDRDRFVPSPWNNRATGRPSLNDDTNWTP
jgi:hypothetical protein